VQSGGLADSLKADVSCCCSGHFADSQKWKVLNIAVTILKATT